MRSDRADKGRAQDHVSEHGVICILPAAIRLEAVAAESARRAARCVGSPLLCAIDSADGSPAVYSTRDGYVRASHRPSLSYDDARTHTRTLSLSTPAHEGPAPPKHHMLQPRRSTSLIRSLSPSPALVVHHQPMVLPSGSPLAVLAELPRRSSECARERRSEDRESYDIEVDGEVDAGRSDEPFLPPEEAELGGADPSAALPLTTRDTAHLAAVFCFAWIAANWSLNASLGLTSVGSSTILAGMSGKLQREQA